MTTLSELTAQIIAARVAKKDMTKDELYDEMKMVHKMLKEIETGEAVATVEAIDTSEVTVNYKRAFRKDEVICLICGKGGYKTLKKHLLTAHNITAANYKKMFNIPAKLPLVARSYSAAKKQVAQERGLGLKLAAGRKEKVANTDANTKTAKTAKEA